MAKKKTVLFANVVERHGKRVYTSFGRDLQVMIEEAETWKHGVIAIEEAHANKSPVWERPASDASEEED